MSITLRLTKGSALEYSELDNNFITLRDVASQTSGALSNVTLSNISIGNAVTFTGGTTLFQQPIGIGALNSVAALRIQGNVLGPQVQSNGIAINLVFDSGHTSAGRGILVGNESVAGVYNLPVSTGYEFRNHFKAGAETVTDQNGFYVVTDMTAGVNNYAFRSQVTAGANKWNLYMQGTASNYLEGQIQAGNGTVGAPSFSFATSTGIGFYYNGVNSLVYAQAGANKVGFNAGGITMQSGMKIDYFPDGTASLLGDTSHVIAQRSGGNAQTFRVYNTFSDASNYERGVTRFTGGALEIGHEFGGTGVTRVLRLFTAGDSAISFAVGGSDRWLVDTSGGAYTLRPTADNTSDLGTSTTRKVRSIYAGTMIQSQGGGGGTASGMQVVAANPAIMLGASGQAVDTKYWDFFINGTVLTGRITNDANSVGANWLTVTRTTTVIGNISFFGGTVAGEQLRLVPVSSAVNRIEMSGGATASSCIIAVEGEANVGLGVRGKGSGTLTLGNGTGDIQWNKALVALGGGAAPTFGTVGGSGPATAAQNTWMRIVDSTGATFWVPAWK